MKKHIFLALATAIFGLSASAQNIDGRSTLINGNQNFQIGAVGTYLSMNGDNLFGGGAELTYNLKRLRLSAEYVYAKDGHVDRSFANAGVGVALVGNPNVKVRPYLIGRIGGASQTSFSCYQTQVQGGNENVDVDMNFVHVYKNYDWNLQTSLEFRVDFVLSKLITLSAFVNGIYNPFEGDQTWSDLGDVNIDAPQGTHFEVSLSNLKAVVKDNELGYYAGVNLSFRF